MVTEQGQKQQESARKLTVLAHCWGVWTLCRCCCREETVPGPRDCPPLGHSSLLLSSRFTRLPLVLRLLALELSASLLFWLPLPSV